LIGFVAVSNDTSLVGTMTSGGTEVIEMPASTSSPTTRTALEAGSGARVVEMVASGGMVVVATVGSGAVDATVGAVEAGGLDDVGAAGAAPPRPHAAARSATATRKDFDLTRLPTTERAPYCSTG
jgi:hypothetical protein